MSNPSEPQEQPPPFQAIEDETVGPLPLVAALPAVACVGLIAVARAREAAYLPRTRQTAGPRAMKVRIANRPFQRCLHDMFASPAVVKKTEADVVAQRAVQR